MIIDESRDHGATDEIDDPSAWCNRLLNIRSVPYPQNSLPTDSEGLGDLILRVDCNYLAINEHRIRCRRDDLNCIVRH
jgi:hypothetical protein